MRLAAVGKRHIIFFGYILLSSSLLISWTSTLYAAAITNDIPDKQYVNPNDAAVMLVDAKTKYVDSKVAQLGVWSKNPVMKVIISNPNFCTNNNDFDSYEKEQPFRPENETNKNITKFTLKKAGTEGDVKYGKVYASGNSRCNDTITLTANAGGEKVPGMDYYRLKLKIGSAGETEWGYMNGYTVKALDGAKIGVDQEDETATRGAGATFDQINSSPEYITYTAEFGTRCDLDDEGRTTELKEIFLYDLDNLGGSGAQQGREVKVTLKDLTTGNLVKLGNKTEWIPKEPDNFTSSTYFIARAEHKYQLIISDVYYNNTLQLSVPYPQITALPCDPVGPPTPPTDAWSLNPSVGFINGVENGVYISGQNNVEVNWNNGLSGVPGGLGDGQGEGNVNGGHNYVDVNASLNRNGINVLTNDDFRLKYFDQGNGSKNKSDSMDLPDDPGQYCAALSFPYGEIGRRKTVNALNGATDPKDSTKTWAEPSKKDHNNAADTSEPKNTYDWVRRYRTFYSGINIQEVQASTYKNLRGSLDANFKPEQNPTIRYGFLPNAIFTVGTAEYSATSDFSNHFWSFYGHENGARSVNGWTPEKCVYVIKPTPNKTNDIEYEKGSGGSIKAGITIDTGGATLPAVTSVGWRLKITGGGLNIDKPVTAKTDGTNLTVDNVFTPAEQSTINGMDPGTKLTYSVVVDATGEKEEGTITVVEVPFARFYGNDIYATREDATGEIRFNDATSDPDYNGKGSASQYAALAFGAVKIDTAAYRHPDYYASFNANAAITSTLPPNGLDAANSKFGARSATDEYNKVVANIPNNCTAFPGNLNVATGCYTATGETTINATNYSNKVTLKAETVVIKGNNVVVPPPPPPAPDPPAPQPDPKPRDDGLNVVTISTIDSNRRSYERTFDVGSYYSVDKLFGSTGVRCGEYIFSPCIRDITFRKPGYKVTFVGSRFLGGEVTVTNNFNYRSITGDRTFLSWQAANQRYIQYFKVESTAPAAVTNRVSPMAPTPAAEAAFVGDPPEAGPLDGADPNLPTGIALIVADNIYIDKSVERIDAILVAKNAIYTCTEGAAQIPNADLENTNKCRKTLTVNGAISAPTIKFQRVGGSRYLNNPRSADDKETCHISHGIQNCDARGDIANDSGKTAEVINFPAYLYFTSPYLKNNTDPGTPRLDNMFTAPPRQ